VRHGEAPDYAACLQRTVRVDYNPPFDYLLARLVPAQVHHDLSHPSRGGRKDRDDDVHNKDNAPRTSRGAEPTLSPALARSRVLIRILWWS